MHSFNTSETGKLSITSSVSNGTTSFCLSSDITHTNGNLLEFGNNTGVVASIQYAGSFKTTSPNSGVAQAFKVGSRVTGAFVISTGNYVQFELNGEVLKLALVN